MFLERSNISHLYYHLQYIIDYCDVLSDFNQYPVVIFAVTYVVFYLLFAY